MFRSVDILQIHVAHACNLTCESCSHYSNHRHSGITQLQDAEDWMSLWSRRLETRRFVLVGGEPTIHPNLPDFIPLVRRHWPAAHIRLFTNGFFLHRHPNLPELLHADPNIELCLSVHHPSLKYQNRLRPIFDLLDTWQAKHPFHLTILHSHANWTRRYHGYGASMMPFEDGQQRESWEICPAKHCKQLFEGKIWKCPPLAYLKLQQAKFALPEAWNRYLAYQPLDPRCSDSELDAFIAKEDEIYCRMCPAQPQPLVLDAPIRLSEEASGTDVSAH